MTPSLRSLLASDAPAAVLLIRLMVGAVFVSEGIQKSLFPAALGVGRFTKIGIPSPEVLAPFRRRRRDCRWAASVPGAAHAARRCLAHHGYARSDCNYEDPAAAARRLLEDGT